MNTLPEKYCSRCSLATDRYVAAPTGIEEEVVLCASCCTSFLGFELSTKGLDPRALVEYATNTQPGANDL